MKFSRILWRRPRLKLSCGAKERKKNSVIQILAGAIGRESVVLLILRTCGTRPVRFFTACFPKIHFIMILPSHLLPCLTVSLLPLKFINKTLA
jgi:hypothetical protein